MMPEKKLIIAHRGFSAGCPENTLAAFRAAEKAGAPMVELDVTLTRDRQVVVIHDDAVDRTTDGKGPVAGFTLDELKRLDAGAWFDPGFSGERIPTLIEVFDALGKGVGINIEIKGSAAAPEFPPDAVERQVVRLAAEHAGHRRILISSFHWACLSRVRELASRVNIAVLSSEPATADAVAVCRGLNAFSWHPDCEKLDGAEVAMMRDAGFRVIPYTVNDPGEIKRFFEMGVDGVITDDPAAALRLDLAAENR